MDLETYVRGCEDDYFLIFFSFFYLVELMGRAWGYPTRILAGRSRTALIFGCNRRSAAMAWLCFLCPLF
ncbi:acyl carrier protein 1, chloroplastic-like [Dorcoceras hygrometricum]|uniref:Acyl carrier protein 1, chloroplastic-like n=1 Tax=Dorcoceras hygrometricum TaxID=472368 RepID=A0A2Z7BAJ3_9LAMI|nr:acyl carrier protein 1, chloroplastic-like [Dorcoceras hygrometricum]